MMKAEVAVKKAPATGLGNTLVTRTVTPKMAIAATAAPARFSVPPRATSASRACPVPGLGSERGDSGGSPAGVPARRSIALRRAYETLSDRPQPALRASVQSSGSDGSRELRLTRPSVPSPRPPGEPSVIPVAAGCSWEGSRRQGGPYVGRGIVPTPLAYLHAIRARPARFHVVSPEHGIGEHCDAQGRTDRIVGEHKFK